MCLTIPGSLLSGDTQATLFALVWAPRYSCHAARVIDQGPFGNMNHVNSQLPLWYIDALLERPSCLDSGS